MTDNDDQAMRVFTERLFSHREQADEPVPDPKPGNHVPSEGGNTDPTPQTDRSMREFVRDLFGRDLT